MSVEGIEEGGSVNLRIKGWQVSLGVGLLLSTRSSLESRASRAYRVGTLLATCLTRFLGWSIQAVLNRIS